MAKVSMKVIYSPDGEREVHTFSNAYDLLSHAGYTVRPKSEPEPEPIEEAEDENDPETDVNNAEDDEVEVPDFEAMTKEQLEDYAKEHFNETVDKRKSQVTLAAEVMALYREHQPAQ